MNKTQVLTAYYAQASYFLKAAHLATLHRKEQPEKQSAYWSNFEAVTVGTNHSFAAEILIKGIMLANHEEHDEGHSLAKLLKSGKSNNLYQKLKKSFNNDAEKAESLKQNDFDYFLSTHSKMFEHMRYACESTPPGLNMDFTSYLCEYLLDEYKVRCEIA